MGTIVYELNTDDSNQAILSDKNLSIPELYDAYQNGSLENKIAKSSFFISNPLKNKPDFYAGIIPCHFCANEKARQRMELNSCPDIDLFSFKLEDEDESYYFVMVNNIIDVRNYDLPSTLSTTQNPNGSLGINPNHPLLDRTMLFMNLSKAPYAPVIPSVFYVSIDGSEHYDFLKRYNQEKLCGLRTVEICRS